MGWVRLAVALIAVAVFAPAVAAQTPDGRKCANSEFDARSEALDELGPFAGASYKSGFSYVVNGPNCRIITFYRLPPKLPPAKTAAEMRKLQQEYKDKTASAFFAARYVDDSRSFNYKPRWTDQQRCPALVPALEKLEPILAPKLVGDSPYRDVSEEATDGPTLRLWAAGQVYPQTDPAYTLDITMEGGGNTAALGQWLNETFKALEGCWSADPPVAP